MMSALLRVMRGVVSCDGDLRCLRGTAARPSLTETNINLVRSPMSYWLISQEKLCKMRMSVRLPCCDVHSFPSYSQVSDSSCSASLITRANSSRADSALLHPPNPSRTTLLFYIHSLVPQQSRSHHISFQRIVVRYCKTAIDVWRNEAAMLSSCTHH